MVQLHCHFSQPPRRCFESQVDVTAAQAAAATRGGAEIAATKQDVQSIEPREFFQGSEQDSAHCLLHFAAEYTVALLN